jgi:4-diphosphocytidyl-2-C-methyl-D-erythritol kinase
VTVRVPAKINLQLAVGPLRPDGYHDLVTVFHAVSLFDEVTVARADVDNVSVVGEGSADVPADGDNLALRAVRALRDRTGAGGPVRVAIAKRIPVAAGMAGGSADAAAALVACDALWGTGLTAGELSEVAAQLGSDVPFALLGGTAVGRGRGERLAPVGLPPGGGPPVPPGARPMLCSPGGHPRAPGQEYRPRVAPATYHWVLAYAHGSLSTPLVYKTLDQLRAAEGDVGTAGPGYEPELSTALMAALTSGDVAGLGAALSNDLQAPALSLFPALRETLAAGRAGGALGALVSGSGPTCFFLARDPEHARSLAATLSGAGVARAVATASGPVPGATVVRSEPARI